MLINCIIFCQTLILKPNSWLLSIFLAPIGFQSLNRGCALLGYFASAILYKSNSVVPSEVTVFDTIPMVGRTVTTAPSSKQLGLPMWRIGKKTSWCCAMKTCFDRHCSFNVDNSRHCSFDVGVARLTNLVVRVNAI